MSLASPRHPLPGKWKVDTGDRMSPQPEGRYEGSSQGLAGPSGRGFICKPQGQLGSGSKVTQANSPVQLASPEHLPSAVMGGVPDGPLGSGWWKPLCFSSSSEDIFAFIFRQSRRERGRKREGERQIDVRETH
uniref:Uncharacterized protein n=1 Tax=Molossus molossus TaxID=27622 RepID=A0A7J8C8T6_MOLMO|nr:hypothetical protein HJG59_009916 [Molossus molossus]